MNESICKICANQVEIVFSGLMLKKHKAEYCSCSHCGFLFVSTPHWLPEAYSSAIANADTGLVYRNNLYAAYISRYLFLLGKNRNRCLDLSGGTGLFTRLMRDNGFDYYWEDLYCENIHARGFEYKRLPSGSKVPIISAFEVLEHLEDPLHFIRQAFSYPGAEVLIVSTELFSGQPPSLQEWDYYMPETGQHIAFFQKKTLQSIAKILNIKLTSFGNLHVFSRKSIPSWLLWFAQLRPNPLPIPIIRKFVGSRIIEDHKKLLSN